MLSACGFEPHSFQLLFNHIWEIKLRFYFYLFSWLFSSSIAYVFLPDLLKFSPFYFLNFRWEDALFSLIIISLIIGFVICFPLLLFHCFLFFIPALFRFELLVLTFYIFYFSSFLMLFWLSTPLILFRLPTFYLSFHTDTIWLTPLLQDLLDIIVDYFLCSFIIILIPWLIKLKTSRFFLYLFALLLSSIFSDWFTILLILLPLSLFIELSFFFTAVINRISTKK